MADANTTLYGFVKPEVGASADTWGAKLNTDYDDIDGLLGAYTLTGSANAYVLTTGMSLAAYASGQRFCVKWNHTNSGTATLNVDSLGAKTIKKRDAATNCSASDLVSGTYGIVAYDGTNFVLLSHVASDVIAPDATLTALAALSWSSGNALVQFTAADTVSLTLTPSVSSVTASQGAAATTPSGTLTNTTDNATNLVAVFQSLRATQAANDQTYVEFRSKNSAASQAAIARITSTALSITNGTETGDMRLGVANGAGSISNYAVLSSTTLRPNSNDLIALGTTTQSFADLFLASGGVINWNNGNFTLTQSSGTLEASGTVRARIPLSSETGTPTSASVNKKVALASGPTINSMTADDFILFDPGTSARTFTRGAGMTMYLNGADAATATLAANQMGTVHWRSASVVVLSGAFS